MMTTTKPLFHAHDVSCASALGLYRSATNRSLWCHAMRSLNPQPKRWPRCSLCKAAYVLRLGIVIQGNTSAKWVWQRDCKHRKAAAELAP